MRRLSAIVATLLATGLQVAPAGAFQVFLDHNTDGDLYTIDSTVEGLLSAPITVIVEFGPEDATRTYVIFGVSWDCHEGPPGSDLIFPHGNIEWVYGFPALPPFLNPEMSTCLAHTCGCEAGRAFWADIPAPITSGRFEFGTFTFFRYPEYSLVHFQAGPSSSGTLTFFGPTGVESRTWGRVRALYR